MSEYEKGEKYVCRECKKPYAWNWVNRHLVSVHGYRYWDNDKVYKPTQQSTNKEEGE